MHYNRIIIFGDYGVDDAAATLHILRHADYDMLDVVPIGGNIDVSSTYRNAHTLLGMANADAARVRIVDTRGIAQSSADIPDVHGTDGLGDIFSPRESGLVVVDFAEFAIELKATAKPERDCVLSLGPCTVPVMLGYIPFCTVLMGGANKESPNFGDYEFNEALDPPAFKKFAFSATAVATLDTCHDPRFGFDGLCTGDELTDRFIARCRELAESRGVDVFAVYDYVAALAVTDPQRFETERIRRRDGVEFNELRLI